MVQPTGIKDKYLDVGEGEGPCQCSQGGLLSRGSVGHKSSAIDKEGVEEVRKNVARLWHSTHWVWLEGKHVLKERQDTPHLREVPVKPPATPPGEPGAQE